MTTIKPGDVLKFKQDNGHVLEIIVYRDTILIKARNLLTDLRAERESSFSVRASAVNKNQEN